MIFTYALIKIETIVYFAAFLTQTKIKTLNI